MQKYIIIDEIYPIVFDLSLNHCDVAKDKNITSAGFIDRDGTCFGLSDTLGITSKKTDTSTIRRFLRVSFSKEVK